MLCSLMSLMTLAMTACKTTNIYIEAAPESEVLVEVKQSGSDVDTDANASLK